MALTEDSVEYHAIQPAAGQGRSMSTLTAEPTAPRRRAARPNATILPRVVTSEWIKFRTLRSSWSALGAAVLGMVGFSLVVAVNTRHWPATRTPNDLVAVGAACRATTWPSC